MLRTERVGRSKLVQTNLINWVRRRTFHEPNALSLVRIMKSSTFGLHIFNNSVVFPSRSNLNESESHLHHVKCLTNSPRYHSTLVKKLANERMQKVTKRSYWAVTAIQCFEKSSLLLVGSYKWSKLLCKGWHIMLIQFATQLVTKFSSLFSLEIARPGAK